MQLYLLVALLVVVVAAWADTPETTAITTASCSADVRASVGAVWQHRTTKRCADNPPILWISSREGLLSHFFQAERLWRISVLFHRRPLVIAPFVSKHYGDQLVRICDYFAVPRDVICVPAPRFSQEAVPPHPASCACNVVANSTVSALTQFSNFSKLEYFNLTGPSRGGKSLVVEGVDFGEAPCVAGFVEHFNGFPEPEFRIIKSRQKPFKWTVDGAPAGEVLVNITDIDKRILATIKVPSFPFTGMSRQFVSLVPVLRAALGVDGVGRHFQKLDWLKPFISPHSDDTTHALIVVHWRRGDYLTGSNSRCVRLLDTSVNCNSTEDFISAVRKRVAYYRWDRRKYTVYVATNEEDPASLLKLRKAGFKVKADILRGLHSIVAAERDYGMKLADIFPLSLPLSAADDFAIDMALVCSAEEHLHFGYSNYNKFVVRCRPKRGTGWGGGGGSRGGGSGGGKGRGKTKGKSKRGGGKGGG